MKKLILVLVLFAALIFACNPMQGQITTLQMSPSQTYVEYSTDVTLTNAVAQYFLVYSQAPWYTAQSFIVNLDSLAGNHTNVACALYGRVSDQTSTWTAIGSAIDWAGTTSDTTIIFLNATENQYRQFKILFTGTGTGTTTIDNFEFKAYYGLP